MTRSMGSGGGGGVVACLIATTVLFQLTAPSPFLNATLFLLRDPSSSSSSYNSYNHQNGGRTDSSHANNKFTNKNQRKKICESSKHLFASSSGDGSENDSDMHTILQQAEWFHNQGGNLKTIQQFLDANIDQTYERLGVTYTPKGRQQRQQETALTKTNKQQQQQQQQYSIRKAVHEDLQANDVHDRGGYDQHGLAGQWNNALPMVQDDATRRGNVDVLEPSNGTEKWIAAMGPRGPRCRRLHAIRGPQTRKHEEKYMCHYDDFRKKKKSAAAANTNGNNNCTMISIGSNDEWGFERVVTRQTMCKVHTFDCTLSTDAPHQKPPSEAVRFHNVCIGAAESQIIISTNDSNISNSSASSSSSSSSSSNRTYETYRSLLQRTGSTEAPTYLKMDVEGFEYDVLTSMLQEDSAAAAKQQESSDQEYQSLLPQQINIELHYLTRMYDLPWMMRSRQAGELSMLFGIMYRLGGYLPVHYEYNEGCPSCLEVLFVRIFC